MTQAYQTPFEDPSFKSMMQHFQLGEWKMGMDIFENLRETYPVSQELSNLYDEVQVRMRIDEYEVEERRRVRQRQSLQFTIRAGAIIALVASTASCGCPRQSEPGYRKAWAICEV